MIFTLAPFRSSVRIVCFCLSSFPLHSVEVTRIRESFSTLQKPWILHSISFHFSHFLLLPYVSSIILLTTSPEVLPRVAWTSSLLVWSICFLMSAALLIRQHHTFYMFLKYIYMYIALWHSGNHSIDFKKQKGYKFRHICNKTNHFLNLGIYRH